MGCECDVFPEGSNKRNICEGKTHLPLAKVNFYRGQWGLPPLTESKTATDMIAVPSKVLGAARDTTPPIKAKAGCGCGASSKQQATTRPRNRVMAKLTEHIDRAAKLAAATAKHLADDAAETPQQALAFRESQCARCVYNTGTHCSICTCPLGPNLLNAGKLRWRSESCPLGMWSRHSESFAPLSKPVRNLIFHIYPARSGEWCWKWHCAKIREYAHHFNGQICIGVVQGAGLASVEDVQQELAGVPVSTWVIRENARPLGETATFTDLLQCVETHDSNHITFRGHTKGVTHPRGQFFHKWAELLWTVGMDIPAVEDALASHVFAGAMKSHEPLVKGRPYAWFFAGSFYWFRNAPVFAREWHRSEPIRWWSEAWPSALATVDEAACLCHDYTKGATFSEAYFSREVEADFIRRQGATQSRVVSPTITHEPGVTLITPTGDRPDAFRLCEKWMQRQTFSGQRQWIVVDDGKIPTRTTTPGVEYIRRPPAPGHTLTANLRAAIPQIKHDRILIIEDDEWYAPTYIQQMMQWLDKDTLTGTGLARYYWPRLARWKEFPDHKHASLCRTGFRAELLDVFRRCCAHPNPSVDMRLWSMTKGVRHDVDQPLVVGMKQMPGRQSGGGNPEHALADADLTVLRSWIGEDVDAYRRFLPKNVDQSRATREKIVVYTVVLGGYDTIRTIRNPNPHVRYVAITDGSAPSPWEIMKPPYSAHSTKHQSREWKITGPQLFPDADWTIYVDGQLELVCDPVTLLAECEAFGQADLYAFRHQDRDCIYDEIAAVARINRDRAENMRAQMLRYRAAGFPQHAGLYLGGMLIRRGHGATSAFDTAWWREVSTGSYRDQISMPVAISESRVPFIALPAMWWSHFFLRHEHQQRREHASAVRRSR